MPNYRIVMDDEYTSEELYHYGIPGMKWGKHKAQQAINYVKNASGYNARGQYKYAKGQSDAAFRSNDYAKADRWNQTARVFKKNYDSTVMGRAENALNSAKDVKGNLRKIKTGSKSAIRNAKYNALRARVAGKMALDNAGRYITQRSKIEARSLKRKASESANSAKSALSGLGSRVKSSVSGAYNNAKSAAGSAKAYASGVASYNKPRANTRGLSVKERNDYLAGREAAQRTYYEANKNGKTKNPINYANAAYNTAKSTKKTKNSRRIGNTPFYTNW